MPLTVHNILLDTLPKDETNRNGPQAIATTSNNTQPEKVEEKLLLASVSNATIAKSPDALDSTEITNDFNEPMLDPKQFRGYPRSIRPPKDFLQINGSDCELNWIFLLIAILALCVIVPLIYVFLIYEHPEKFHSIHSKYDDPELHIIHHGDHVQSTLSSH